MRKSTAQIACVGSLAISGLMILCGCSTAPSTGPKNGLFFTPPEYPHPLTVEIVRAFVPKEPQIEKGTKNVTKTMNFNTSSGSGSTTYVGPMEHTSEIVSLPQHSPIVVEFRILNQTKEMIMHASDLQLFDGQGGVHQAQFERGYDANGNEPWSSVYLQASFDPYPDGRVRSMTWMFVDVPDNAIKGSSIHFQGTVYTLPIDRK